MYRFPCVMVSLLLALAGAAYAADWQTEMVDRSGPGKFSSLRIDKEGNVHVAYVIEDGNRYPLKYAFWDHNLRRWFVMPVAEGSGPCSLALDSKQRPHISYVDYGTASGAHLRYAAWDGTTWRKQVLPLTSDVIAYYNSIALDTADRPTISFYEYRGPRDTEIHIRLRNVIWNGTYWEVRTVDQQEGSGKFNCTATDTASRIHIAYANVSAMTAGLRYAFWDGKQWNREIVDGAAQNGGDGVGYSACLALDSEGNPHVSYVNESHPALKYAVRKNGRWLTQTVDRMANIAYPDRTAIAMDDLGKPYIAYYDGGLGMLKMAHPQDGRWMVETLDESGAGFTASMQIDAENIWVSYTDEAGSCLKVAHRPRTAVERSERAR